MTQRVAVEPSHLLSQNLCNEHIRWVVITTVGPVVVESEIAESARDKLERKGYIVLEVNRDARDQRVSF